MTRYRFLALTAFLSFFCFTNSPTMGQEGFSGADTNEDGKVSATELETYVSGKLQGFDQFKELMKELDADNDGSLSEEEFGNRMTAVRLLMGQGQAARETPKMKSKDTEDEKPKKKKGKPALKVGDVAPPFNLDSLDGKSKTELAQFKGSKPVILIFGSYT